MLVVAIRPDYLRGRRRRKPLDAFPLAALSVAEGLKPARALPDVRQRRPLHFAARRK